MILEGSRANNNGAAGKGDVAGKGRTAGDGRMEEIGKGKAGQEMKTKSEKGDNFSIGKKIRIVLLLFLTLLVLFGGRSTWLGALEKQAEGMGERSREKIPFLFEWVFRHYYPGAFAEGKTGDGGGNLEKSGWLDWLWDSLPIYRQGNKAKESFQQGELLDPAYRNYGNNRKFQSEYEALLGWGGEETENRVTEGEEDGLEAASDIPAKTGICYSVEQLADYDFLMRHFFSVHPSTTAGRDIMDAQAFLEKDFKLTVENDQPQILIYHTHSQETYADYGPENPEANVTGLGTCLTRLLEEKGYYVIHDTTSYDLMGGTLDRSKAYTYALEGISKILQEHPSIQVILDIHRDGVREGYHMVSQVNGKSTAPVMFFLGMSRTPTESIEYLPNLNLEGNLAFSFQLQLKAEEYFPGLTRKIYLKGLRYNLHLRPCSALIEAGAQTNTYEEAKNAMEPLAEVLDMVLQGK